MNSSSAFPEINCKPWLQFFAAVISLILLPTSGFTEAESDHDKVHSLANKFLQHARDFHTFANPSNVSTDEFQMAMYLENVASSCWQQADFIAEELFIAAMVTGESDRQNIKRLIHKRIQATFKLDVNVMSQINMPLGMTRRPAIVAQCNKFKDDLSDFYKALEEIEKLLPADGGNADKAKDK